MYYYVSFYKVNGKTGDWSIGSTLIDIHPLEWNTEEYYGYRFTVISWHEVSKDVYDKHYDRLA